MVGQETNCKAKVKEDPKKPPIGLEPRTMFEETRHFNVCLAIREYCKAGIIIPIEWTEEYNEYIIKYSLKRKQ